MKVTQELEQQTCEDYISRQAVLNKIKEVCFSKEWVKFRADNGSYGQRDFLINYIEQLPSVTPQQKMGRWIESTGYDDRDHFYTCSEYGRNINLICGAELADYPYCHCGAKMQGVEREDK